MATANVFWLAWLAVGLGALFYTTVYPNFSAKAIPVAWMTAIGALVVLGYSIFVELTEESSEVRFPVDGYFTLDYQPFNLLIPPWSNEGTPLWIQQPEGEIAIAKSPTPPDAEWAIALGQELVLLNVLNYLSAEYRDWRKDVVKGTSGQSQQFRKPTSAGGDSVIYQHDVLNKSRFAKIKIRVKERDDLKDYGIYPPGTSLISRENTIDLENPHFRIKVDVYPLHQLRGHDGRLRSEYEVRVSYLLKKFRSGSPHRSTYRSFCQKLTEDLKQRLTAQQGTSTPVTEASMLKQSSPSANHK